MTESARCPAIVPTSAEVIRLHSRASAIEIHPWGSNASDSDLARDLGIDAVDSRGASPAPAPDVPAASDDWSGVDDDFDDGQNVDTGDDGTDYA